MATGKRYPHKPERFDMLDIIVFIVVSIVIGRLIVEEWV